MIYNNYKYCNITRKEKLDDAVTLDQAKNHLSVDSDFKEDDSIISLMIGQATRYVEDYIGQDVVYKENIKEFFEYNGSYLEILESPYNEIISLTIITDNIETSLSEGEDFEVQTKYSKFIIRFKNNIKADKLVIKFYTGNEFSDINQVQQAAILIVLNDLYDLDRTSKTVGAKYEVSDVLQRLLSAYVIKRW